MKDIQQNIEEIKMGKKGRRFCRTSHFKVKNTSSYLTKMETRNIVEIVTFHFRQMLRSIYGQQVFTFYDFSKENYFEQYWNLLQILSYDTIEEFILSRMENFHKTEEERKELILGVLDREFQERDLVIYEGNKIWREYFFNLWDDIKSMED